MFGMRMQGGMDTGPSQGFMQRFKQGMPGALNKAAQDYGDPNSQRIAKQTGRMMPPRPNRGTNRSGVPQNGPMGQTPASDSSMNGGMPNIVRGPSMPPFGGGMLPGGMNGGFLPTMPTSSQIPGLGMGNGGGMGGGNPNNFWQMYNQMSGGNPLGNRQIFT